MESNRKMVIGNHSANFTWTMVEFFNSFEAGKELTNCGYLFTDKSISSPASWFDRFLKAYSNYGATNIFFKNAGET